MGLYSKNSRVSILGRAWVYEHDPPELEVWEHEFEPMDNGSRSGAEWAHEHLCECYSAQDIREMFKLPAEGDYQVIFKGTLEGAMSGYYEPEWDEWFEVEESNFQKIPFEYKKFRLEVKNSEP